MIGMSPLRLSFRPRIRRVASTPSMIFPSEPAVWSDPVLEKLDYYLGLPEQFPAVKLSYSSITFG